MDVTDQIKSQLDIVNFIGNVVELKKSGRNYKGLCPFHNEKTPSFVVFPESQHWRCFGACSDGGDLFSFVMRQEGLDFPDALRMLAEQAGIELKPVSENQLVARETAQRLAQMLEEVASFYHRVLLNAPEADTARRYLEQRGMSAQNIAHFQLGYAPNSWDATMNMLLEKGYSRDDLISGGVVVERDEDGRIYDRFRGRLVIPIHDARGSVVGFGARTLEKDGIPKYINSPQSDIFDKSRTLYGLSNARRSIRETETAVIVEGYMDVLQAHQAGFTNVVAEMGTALTEQQLNLLSRYANRLVLALDADAAGEMATERGREVIERVSRAAAEQAGEEGIWDLDAVEREYRAKLSVEFDAQGMLHYESRLGFDIRVIVLPGGKDPDDIIRETPEIWMSLVENALPVVEYAIQRAVAGRDLNDPKIKAQIVDQLTPLIENVANPVERSHYTQRIARLLRIPENTLFPARTASNPGRAAHRQPAQPAPPRLPADRVVAKSSATHSSEVFCLAALLQYPRLIYHINGVFYKALVGEAAAEGDIPVGTSIVTASYLSSYDFSHPAHRSIFTAWIDSLDQDSTDPLERLKSSLDPVGVDLVSNWLGKPLYTLLWGIKVPDTNLTYEKVFEEVVRASLNLRRKRLEEHSQELAYMLDDMGNGGDSSAVWEYGEAISQLMAAKQKIAKALEMYGQKGRQIKHN